MVQAGIIGGAGYTAGELIRILLWHKHIQIKYVHSKSHAGQALTVVHSDLEGDTELAFTDKVNFDVDVLFLCVGHGEARAFMSEYKVPSEVRIVDLSEDFRLHQNAVTSSHRFVYGLPELNLSAIQEANAIANPGCFATAMQLALLPLAAHGLVKDEIHINGITGSTGAGRKPSETSHYSWRSGNVSVYKAFEHQHLREVMQMMIDCGISHTVPVNFVPMRGPFTRGILVTAYTRFGGKLDEAQGLYETFYYNAPFVHLTDREADVKSVVNTNKCVINLQKHGQYLLVTSVIDNLLKGASGQAVQNANLLFGFEQSEGLRLKSVGF